MISFSMYFSLIDALCLCVCVAPKGLTKQVFPAVGRKSTSSGAALSVGCRHSVNSRFSAQSSCHRLAACNNAGPSETFSENDVYYRWLQFPTSNAARLSSIGACNGALFVPASRPLVGRADRVYKSGGLSSSTGVKQKSF